MFLKKIKPVYLIIGGLFLIGIILIIVGNSSNDKVIINDKNYYITLNGDEEIMLYQGSEYVEPGYAASDSTGANLTNQVKENTTCEEEDATEKLILTWLSNMDKKSNLNFSKYISI